MRLFQVQMKVGVISDGICSSMAQLVLLHQGSGKKAQRQTSRHREEFKICLNPIAELVSDLGEEGSVQNTNLGHDHEEGKGKSWQKSKIKLEFFKITPDLY